jgi:signal transduction histidine kinase
LLHHLLDLQTLSTIHFRPRSLWRDRVPFGPEEIRRTERWLATARVFLAISALIAVWMDPAEIRSIWAYALLAIYIAQGTAIMLLLRWHLQSTPSFRLLVHGSDVIWPALISLFTTSQSNPFFLFFLFVLVAAAYRWGVWETVMTAVASLSLLWLGSLALTVASTRLWLAQHHLQIAKVPIADFDPKHLLMRSVYLLVMALLLGYLAEQQKKLRAEKEVATRMLGLVRMDAGLGGALSQIIGELLKLYDARRALIVSREASTPRVSVGSLELKNGIPVIDWLDPGVSGAATYLGESAASAWYASSHRNAMEFSVLGVNAAGGIVREMDPTLVRNFAEVHPFAQMCAVYFSIGQELWGRIFLLEPRFISNVEDELRFLQELVRQISPAVYNLYLLRRLRRRAGALERARLVRELHDGAVQSLIGVEMQVDVLRRNYDEDDGLRREQPFTPSRSEFMAAELERIQNLLREEVLKLRELMQQMKSVEVDARKLPGYLRDAVQKFQRETGIAARFLLDADEISLPPTVCRELARIVQEALVNVRKHSGAKQVVVQLIEAGGNWELIIEDDGAGFPFAGKILQAELDSTGRVPAIIRERVRLIQGELTIESNPGQGARLQILVPHGQLVT